MVLHKPLLVSSVLTEMPLVALSGMVKLAEMDMLAVDIIQLTFFIWVIPWAVSAVALITLKNKHFSYWVEVSSEVT